MAFRTSPTVDTATVQAANKPTLHHVDNMPVNSTPDNPDASHHRASPPPIATLNNSPALSVSSLDRSSGPSPPPRRSTVPNALQSSPVYSSFPYTPDGHIRQHSRPHHNSHLPGRANLNTTHSYPTTYHTHGGTFEHRYELNPPSDHSSYHLHSVIPGPHVSVSSVPPNRLGYGVPYPLPGQNSSPIIHTDDATTKLSERVRRRCFNCCTTDTSTWRRSNLSPGKVLCNKCGLFERTHSRPRPEQFPHKRGPLATSTLRSRTTPSPQSLSQQLPPISTHGHTLPPPHHYSHPSIAPLTSVPEPRRHYQSSNTLPEIQSWLHEPPPTGSAEAPTTRTMAPTPPSVREGTPPNRMQGPAPVTSSPAPAVGFDSRDPHGTRQSGGE